MGQRWCPSYVRKWPPGKGMEIWIFWKLNMLNFIINLTIYLRTNHAVRWQWHHDYIVWGSAC